MPGHYYDWSTPVIKDLEPDVAYHAFWIDPSSGNRYELGVVVNGKETPEKAELFQKALQQLYSGDAEKSKPLRLILNENPRIFPASTIPDISWLPGSEYKPGRLPAPQDWL